MSLWYRKTGLRRPHVLAKVTDMMRAYPALTSERVTYLTDYLLDFKEPFNYRQLLDLLYVVKDIPDNQVDSAIALWELRNDK